MARTLLTALILMTLTLTACGEDFTPTKCSTNADCGAGESCDAQTGSCSYIIGSCASEADCAAGERCEGATATARGTCVEPEPSCADQADPDAFCAAKTPDTVCETTTGLCIRDPNKPVCVTKEDCGADELCAMIANTALCVPNDCSNQTISTYCDSIEEGTICDPTTKRCVPDTARRYIMIQDMSSGASSCDSVTASGLRDAGSDIIYIELNTSAGDILGYGNYVNYIQGSGEVDTTFADIFDGEPRPLDFNGCPDEGFSQQSIVSLGCGGALFVEFIGSEGRAVELVSGQQVIVGEYGPYCTMPGGSLGTDSYTVFLCNTPTQGGPPSEANCTEQLGAATSGPGSFNLR